jgi:hypothetical protein
MMTCEISGSNYQEILIPAQLLREVQANENALANLICDCHSASDDSSSQCTDLGWDERFDHETLCDGFSR